MAEGSMSETMGQENGLAEIFIQSQSPPKGPGMLGHLKGMGKTGTVKIPLADPEDLRFVLKILEISAVKHPVTIPLETGPVIVFFRPMKRPAHALRASDRIRRQLIIFDFF